MNEERPIEDVSVGDDMCMVDIELRASPVDNTASRIDRSERTDAPSSAIQDSLRNPARPRVPAVDYAHLPSEFLSMMS